ncbi:myotubularin-related protein 6 [Eurytemora carolleeae]|uniref:myotubularin-related protein 6 n=1 Tax=Eurytemora carolleeae TaxID=1294199 RepID=UPI000C7783A9|nr:myotubularin-related protein 6 [Eurytemora carolleeae]|eukprot:XP_023349401.1 myotubularin-related protein 6-like [Eurytemora affinis]
MKMEHIATPKVENVHLLDNINPRNSTVGTLYITTTHLIFVSPEDKEELWILHMHISSVDKLPLTTSGSPVRIQCSNFRVVTFMVNRDRDAQDIYTSLAQLSKPSSLEDLYCFQYRAKNDLPQPTGWTFFELSAEFQRQGVHSKHWTPCSLNNEYRLCPTYPRLLMVPSSASTLIVQGSAKFRSKGRLPVLTYYHAQTSAALLRCAQPLSGIKGRSSEDEQFINCILESNTASKFLYIVDTRPKINAMYNRAAGKGYEAEAFYPNTKFVFKGIENIHIMRDSLSKLVETCELKTETIQLFLQGLEQSGWLKHIKAVLEASIFIAESLLNGISVVVHCSDGWDRTSQTCAIAQILIDPFYRTIQVVYVLILILILTLILIKYNLFKYCSGDPKEVSPIFTQFIDATWQILTQFPQAFQFNAKYLLTIHDHVYSCQFGTFLGNCAKDREDYRLAERTYSLWGHLTNTADEFINPLFDSSSKPDILNPSTSPQNIHFWRGFYCRFEVGTHPREPIIDLLTLTQLHTASLEDHAKHLSKRVDGLRSLISSAKASGAVKKFLPSVVTGTKSSTEETESELDKVEKRFVDLKTALVEKCQSSKILELFNLLGDLEDCSPYLTLSVGSPVVYSLHRKRSFEPLSSPSEIPLTLDQIQQEISSVAIFWETRRECSDCSCGIKISYSVPVKNCTSCGRLFCERCMHRRRVLPGHALAFNNSDGRRRSSNISQSSLASLITGSGSPSPRSSLNIPVSPVKFIQMRTYPVCSNCYRDTSSEQ